MKHATYQLVTAAFLAAISIAAHADERKSKMEHINPKGMAVNPAFSQAVRVKAGSDLLFIGGQNSVDAKGKVVAPGDLKGQTTQALKNLQTVLESQGLKMGNVVKWNIHIVQGQSVKDGFDAFQGFWDKRAKPPAITTTIVHALANPDLLVEVDAVAAY